MGTAFDKYREYGRQNSSTALVLTIASIVVAAFFTYVTNVAVNLVVLVLQAKTLAAITDNAATSHAFYTDRLNPSLLSAAVPITVVLLGSLLVRQRQERRTEKDLRLLRSTQGQIDSLQQRIVPLDARIRAYSKKYNRHFDRLRSVLDTIRGKEPVERPIPSAQETAHYHADRERKRRLETKLYELENTQVQVGKSETIKNYQQIVEWLGEDKTLRALTADYLRSRTWLTDTGKTTLVLVATTIATRIIIVLLG